MIISPHVLFLGLLAVCHLVHAVPIALQGRYDSAVGNTLSIRASDDFKVKLRLAYYDRGLVTEHWGLFLKPYSTESQSKMIQALIAEGKYDVQIQLKNVLQTSVTKNWTPKEPERWKYEDIGDANFEGASDYAALNKMDGKQLGKKPLEGGSCIDFVINVLQDLNKKTGKGHQTVSDKVFKTFNEIVTKDDRYTKVMAKTWGTKVKQAEAEAKAKAEAEAKKKAEAEEKKKARDAKKIAKTKQ